MKYLAILLALCCQLSVSARGLKSIFPTLPDGIHLTYTVTAHVFADPSLAARIKSEENYIAAEKLKPPSGQRDLNISVGEQIIQSYNRNMLEHDIPAYEDDYWKAGSAELWNYRWPTQPECLHAFAHNRNRYIMGRLADLAPSLRVNNPSDIRMNAVASADRYQFEYIMPYLGFQQTGKALFAERMKFISTQTVAGTEVEQYDYTPRAFETISPRVLRVFVSHRGEQLVAIKQECDMPNMFRCYAFSGAVKITDAIAVPRYIDETIYEFGANASASKEMYTIHHELTAFKVEDVSESVIGVEKLVAGTAIQDNRYISTTGQYTCGIGYQATGTMPLDLESKERAKLLGATPYNQKK